MKLSIITLFPEIFEPVINHSILKRAAQKGLVEFNLVNHRDFGIGDHRVVDDKLYGGGQGMVLRVDVLADAIEKTKSGIAGEVVILLDPQGVVYHQEFAEKLATLSHIILVCGHYEGVDERVRDLVDYEVSMGDFVLTGGEIPAMALIDSITRLIPGVLKQEKATKQESHSLIDGTRILEGPQYTRPEDFRGQKVPAVFLSGDPLKIEEYKSKAAIEKTEKRRPDLLKD
jgi:tRNA (guanine37-N1)-methyltransferase